MAVATWIAPAVRDRETVFAVLRWMQEEKLCFFPTDALAGDSTHGECMHAHVVVPCYVTDEHLVTCARCVPACDCCETPAPDGTDVTEDESTPHFFLCTACCDRYVNTGDDCPHWSDAGAWPAWCEHCHALCKTTWTAAASAGETCLVCTTCRDLLQKEI
jgi:hypothetical protein